MQATCKTRKKEDYTKRGEGPGDAVFVYVNDRRERKSVY